MVVLFQQSIELVSIVYTHLFCNALVNVINSGVSSQCSHIIAIVYTGRPIASALRLGNQSSASTTIVRY